MKPVAELVIATVQQRLATGATSDFNGCATGTRCKPVPLPSHCRWGILGGWNSSRAWVIAINISYILEEYLVRSSADEAMPTSTEIVCVSGLSPWIYYGPDRYGWDGLASGRHVRCGG